MKQINMSIQSCIRSKSTTRAAIIVVAAVEIAVMETVVMDKAAVAIREQVDHTVEQIMITPTVASRAEAITMALARAQTHDHTQDSTVDTATAVVLDSSKLFHQS